MKRAYTLAEVLITLGIVGVVASLTIPTLIQNYKSKVQEAQYKKGVSIISQNLQMLMAQSGTPGDLSSTPLHTCYENNDSACFANLTSKYFKTNNNSNNQSFRNNFYEIKYTSYLHEFIKGGIFVPVASAGLRPIYLDFNTCKEWAAQGEVSCPTGYKVDPSDNEVSDPADCCIPEESEGEDYSWAKTIFAFQTTDSITIGFLRASKNDNNNIVLYPIMMDTNGTKGPNQLNKDLYILNFNKKGIIEED